MTRAVAEPPGCAGDCRGWMGVGEWRLADRAGQRGGNFSHLAPLIWTRVCGVFIVEIGIIGRFGSRPSLQTKGIWCILA